MRFAIFGKRTDKTVYSSLEQLFSYLQAQQLDYVVDQAYAEDLRPLLPSWDALVKPYISNGIPKGIVFDAVFSFGGDGTLLTTAHKVSPLGIPILGVNFGRLGFLTTVNHTDLIQAIEVYRKGSYRLEERTAILVESHPQGLFGKQAIGLNDLTIHKANTNEMITIHTYINGEFLNSYWGDGLVVSTPTGSTAYSLACGGPIIMPKSRSFLITPVAPHSLTVRPLVVPDDVVLSFEIESRSGQAMVALDNRSELVNNKVEIAVRRAPFRVRLLNVQQGSYFNMLRSRLMWGRDTRN